MRRAGPGARLRAMPRFHIVVTTDFSEASLRAFDAASALAKKLDARVTLLHVLEDVPAIPHGAPLAPPQHAPGGGGRRSAAEQKLSELRARLPADLEVASVVAEGDRVSTTIDQQVEKLGAGLLVIASGGWSAAKGLFMGSTTETLLRDTRVPTLVIPVGSAAKPLTI